MKKFMPYLLMGAALFLASCRTQPEAIIAGEDHCGRCHMQIADTRFGAEVITDKGRVLKFDSFSCLAGYLAETTRAPAQVLVADFLHQGKLIPAEKASFRRMKQMNGPMGPAIIASADEAGLRKLQESEEGEKISWEQLLRSAQ